MQDDREYGKLYVERGWVRCPVCNDRRMLRIDAETEAKRVLVYCRKCKREFPLKIERGLSVQRLSP